MRASLCLHIILQVIGLHTNQQGSGIKQGTRLKCGELRKPLCLQWACFRSVSGLCQVCVKPGLGTFRYPQGAFI